MCRLYVTGYLEGLVSGEVHLAQKGHIVNLYCPPSGGFAVDFVAPLAKEYAHKVHADPEWPAASMIIEALREFYPCTRR